jgi:hypothetical protein
MKLFAEILPDGKINRLLAQAQRPPEATFVEISHSDVAKIFENMEPHYWLGGKVVSRSIPPNVAAYYQSLGTFVQAFARVEATMHGVLKRFCNVSPVIARSIFSGTRTEAAKQYITRIMYAKRMDQPIKTEMKYVFDQLGVINSTRNDIIHFGAEFEGEQLFVNTAMLAHLPEKARRIEVSSKILDQMTADLNKITLHLIVCTMGTDSPDTANFFRIGLNPILQQPWLYKPTQPAPHD